MGLGPQVIVYICQSSGSSRSVVGRVVKALHSRTLFLARNGFAVDIPREFESLMTHFWPPRLWGTLLLILEV